LEEETESTAVRRITPLRNGMNLGMDFDVSAGISTQDLTKKFGSFRGVDHLSIAVDGGEVFGFLGPNGAGKTTTIRMLCGLIRPTSGSAKIAGFDVVKESLKIRRIIGLLPESGGFYNWMNAEEYLLHFAALYKIKDGRARTRELLEKVGLHSKSFVPIGYYSRGMKQKLALARALINQPRILFLDEPTLGLDPKGQQDIRKMLLDLHEKGVTLFLSSHVLTEVSAICNRVAIVNQGSLVAQGTIEELRKLAGDSRALMVRVLDSDEAEAKLSRLNVKMEVRREGQFLDVTLPHESESAAGIIRTFEDVGLQICEVHRTELTLEQVFFNLTETHRRLTQNIHALGAPSGEVYVS
jgi:ABC-2 type transport system ATP-binding protein